jgi:hypothetical protein
MLGAALAAAVLAGTALIAGAQAPQAPGGQGVAPAAAPKPASIPVIAAEETKPAREGPHPMSAAEAEAAKLDADLRFPLDLKRLFTAFAVRPSEKVDGRDAVLLVAGNEGKPPLKLYFDAQTGLLLREERDADTALGYLPTQIDYADYRDVDGVKVAFRWTLARPGGRFTVQVASTKQNVPIDDAKFAMPAPPPKPAG